MRKIRELREQFGLSMLELAARIGVSDAAICKWENGGHEPKATYLIKLADFFGCTTDELLGRENYGTGSVEIIGEKVDEDEKKILGVYRALDKQGKRAFLSMTENLATLHNISLKSKLG